MCVRNCAMVSESACVASVSVRLNQTTKDRHVKIVRYVVSVVRFPAFYSKQTV